MAAIAIIIATPPDEIIRKFDSVNNSLEKVNVPIAQSIDDLYDSIAKKYGESKMQQFYYQLNDCKGFLYDLKSRFVLACGGKSGDILPPEAYESVELTNEYFITNGKGDGLLAYLEDIQKTLLRHTDNNDLKEKITALTQVPFSRDGDGFVKAYFYNTPPVAALTIVSKFENDITTIERQILQEYLRK